MPLTPQDRVRASIALTHTYEMAERLFQHDKANPCFKLTDLRDDDERAIFIADIMELFSPERRAERATRLNNLRAQGFASLDDEQESIEKLARQDGARFGTIRPGYCRICGERVGVCDVARLLISDALWADIHGLCAAKDPDNFQLLGTGFYLVKDGRR